MLFIIATTILTTLITMRASVDISSGEYSGVKNLTSLSMVPLDCMNIYTAKA